MRTVLEKNLKERRTAKQVKAAAEMVVSQLPTGKVLDKNGQPFEERKRADRRSVCPLPRSRQEGRVCEGGEAFERALKKVISSRQAKGK